MRQWASIVVCSIFATVSIFMRRRSDKGGKVEALRKFLESDDQALVCTHASYRFAVDKFGVEVFDGRLTAVDEFHRVSASPDNKLGEHVRQLMAREKTHLVAMTSSCFQAGTEAAFKWSLGSGFSSPCP